MLYDLITNWFIIIPLCAWMLAQTMKMFIALFKGQGLDFRYMVSSGGMPSSHSALVTALATTIGLIQGLGSGEFAIAVIMAFIVMYDSAGVRQASSKQAIVLNTIVRELRARQSLTHMEANLKELIGHTPFQVIVGAAIGIAFSWLWLFIASI